jgi:DNA-directed RNA polymerase specialized sigma24 family protein
MDPLRAQRLKGRIAELAVETSGIERTPPRRRVTADGQDWSVFDDPEVLQVVRKVAAKAAYRYGFVEAEDIVQEASLMVASRADLIEAVETGELGLLHHRLWCDVVDSLKGAASTEAEDAEEHHASLNDTVNGWSAAGAEVDALTFREWAEVEADEFTALGIRRFTTEQRLVIGIHHLFREADVEVERPYTHMVHDAEDAWSRANLTHKQRRAVILILGRGLSRVDAARVTGVDESTIRKRFDRALEILVAEAERSPWARVA